MTTITLQHPDAIIKIQPLATGRRKITVIPNQADLYIAKNEWETAYPLFLIEAILAVKGPAWLCDEIMRDEDPTYLQRNFEYALLGYISREQFKATRILDFGCGSGASTMVLSRLLPNATIVGVEVVEEFVAIAKQRAEFYGCDNVNFFVSPDAQNLPAGIGNFDFIVLSAVYEHLLPSERKMLLPLLWHHLKSRGVLFLNATPYRFLPIESHTTGLPFINYLPDRWAFLLARKFSKKIGTGTAWEALLRQGIRGGSVKEVMKILKQEQPKPVLLSPSLAGVKDRIALWYQHSNSMRPSLSKKMAYGAFKILKWGTGLQITPTLSLAIRKELIHSDTE